MIFPGAKLIQLVEWGFPMGQRRPTPPPDKAFGVIHITANLASAENELKWRRDDPALQNSATFFVNRDGSVVQALSDPLHMDPWSNGDMQAPDTSNPRIAAVVRDRINPNRRTLLSIENVGNEIAWGKVAGGFPITEAQIDTNARIIAYYFPRANLPISRETVIGHYQINSVMRRNCPSRNKSVIDTIVALAQEYAVTDWHDRIEYVDPFVMKIRPCAHRLAPDLTTRGVAELDYPVERTIIGKVRGFDFGAGPVWWVYVSDAVGGLKTIHSQDEIGRRPLTGGITKEEAEKHTAAALAAFNKNLDVWAAQRPRK